MSRSDIRYFGPEQRYNIPARIFEFDNFVVQFGKFVVQFGNFLYRISIVVLKTRAITYLKTSHDEKMYHDNIMN
jgi:hypothetical protein